MTLATPGTHQSLADFIKGVHAHLRRRVQDGVDSDRVWDEHVELEKSIRDRYASAMRDLAINYWENSEPKASRIDWVRDNVCQYFYGCDDWELIKNGSSFDVALSDAKDTDTSSYDSVAEKSGLFSAICKDIRRSLFDAGQLNKDTESGRLVLSEEDAARVHSEGRTRWKMCLCSARRKSSFADREWLGLPLRLLDVGSCFDPFSRFDLFDTLAIDISPATRSVVEMDFTHVDVTNSEGNSSCASEINRAAVSPVEKRQSIPGKSFHVVVFSLLLEYFPSPHLRWTCCWKANKVLTIDGVLAIITPDSSHVNKRAAQMKSWQTALENYLGFKRWRYEKLTHLHCMIYRKVAEVDDVPPSTLDAGELYAMLYIPQDRNQSGTTPVDIDSS